MPKVITAEQAASLIKSGDVVFVHSNGANPEALLDALSARGGELRDVEMIHLLTLGRAPHLERGLEESFIHRAYFIGANARDAVNSGRAFYHPIHLSNYGKCVVARRPNVALLHVSPPRRGCYGLGVSIEAAPEAIDSVKANGGLVIAQVNPRMPYVHGRGFVEEHLIDYLVEVDDPIPETEPPPINPRQRRIGELIAEYLIQDGSTLQVGIGAVPDAAVACAVDYGRTDLGVHTEIYTDALMRATEAGAISNQRKVINNDYAVSGIFIGTQELYEWIHDNPRVQGRCSAYTNNVRSISANPDVVAINGAIGVDLNGSVFADSLAPNRIYSGYGGQCDFMRGAAFTGPNGKPGKGIIALESTYVKDGELQSKIVGLHPAGMNITVTAADPAYIVTEWGIVNLAGLALGERIRALAAIAYPAFRDDLLRQAEQMGGVTQYITAAARARGLPDGVVVRIE
ncbi:MAG: acetyl-CoA hydrolase/transferase family protein [Armatimonadota bacterium]|mgnify:CR=1 FL=1|jgi:acyl-CoA hydrolase